MNAGLKFAGEVKQRLNSRINGNGVTTFEKFTDLDNKLFDNVSMGTRPSGTLHMGNLLVLTTALHYLRINSKASVNIDIMDLDFDTQRGAVFTPYLHLPQTKGFEDQIHFAVETAAQELGLSVDPTSVRVSFFSDKLRDGKLRKVMMDLISQREAIKSLKYAIFGTKGNGHYPPISLICNNCRQSTTDFSEASESEKTFSTKCKNANCEIGNYNTNLGNGELFNVHYLVDPIRDLLYGPNTLHIFGGDYNVKQGQLKAPKYLHIAAAMEVAKTFCELETPIPSFLLTPTIVDREGKKVSKSEQNTGFRGGDAKDFIRDQIVKLVKILEFSIKNRLEFPEIRI